MEILKTKAYLCIKPVIKQILSWRTHKEITKDENYACSAPDRAQINSYHNKHDILHLNMTAKKQVISLLVV
jgi:hypothetical protein